MANGPHRDATLISFRSYLRNHIVKADVSDARLAQLREMARDVLDEKRAAGVTMPHKEHLSFPQYIHSEY